MFRNLVNSQDLTYLVRAIRTGRIGRIVRRALGGRARAVESAWDTTQNPPIQFWDIPQVHQRANALISGDPQIDYIDYVAHKYLSNRAPLSGLSLGCGTGRKEMQWASRCEFARLEAFDIAPQRIADAQAEAAARRIRSVNFQIGDIFRIDWPPRGYDVVFADQSLHHFSPLDTLCAKVARSLKPDGYFILNEYVGPTRFQWTRGQLEAANALLALLPPRYRTRWQDHTLKRRIYRPSRLSMILADPSEAVESARIIPLLVKHFEIVEQRDYGGTLIHPLFADIAWNFQHDDPDTQRLIRICFEVEDALIASGDLSSDFSLMVCRPRRP